MGRVESSKNFASIHNDYTFFQEHSTEAEQDLRSHLRYLLPLVKSGKKIRLLDFGCGDGLFSVRLLSRAGFDPHRLILSLVEPDSGYLRQAISRTQAFSIASASAWPSLPPEQQNSFDLVLANHVFYYVNDLEVTLRQILKALSVGGLFLMSMGGRENVLCQIVDRSFASIRKPMPYQLSENLERTLADMGKEFQKHRVNYEVIFPDLEENRLGMLRFMLGEHFSRMDQGEILKLFDPYAAAGHILIQTYHYQFVIRS
jgi:SAM-dependent methyltransferase